MNKAILITGGAARVGREFSLGLAQDGWSVAVHYNRSRAPADAIVKDITDAGGKAAAVKANLNIPSEVDRLVSRAAQKLDMPLTALINNASTFNPDEAETFSNALFDHHIDVNLRAPLRISQAFAAQLTAGESGAIINMIDQRVLKPNPLFFTYSLSKSALYWSTKTMAQALAPHIRVNGIGPGPALRNTQQSPQDFEDEASMTLLGHGSPPDALLGAARYLLSAKSVTGQMLAVDSGQHLTWQTEDLMIGLSDKVITAGEPHDR